MLETTAGCSLEDGCWCPWQDAEGRAFPEQKCRRHCAKVTKLLSQSKGKRWKPGDLLGATGLSTSTHHSSRKFLDQEVQSFSRLRISHCWLSLASLEAQAELLLASSLGLCGQRPGWRVTAAFFP